MKEYGITIGAKDKRTFSAFFEAEEGLDNEVLAIRGLDALKILLLSNGVSFNSIDYCKVKPRD